MKAFISYSVSDENEILLTLLSQKLREKNFVISTSQSFYSVGVDFNTVNEIIDSHLFIGIVTDKGSGTNRVIQEWQYAVEKNVPNLLLIEDSITLKQNFTGNYIRFNKKNPQTAIEEINQRMTPQQQDSNDGLAWLLGGAALVALLAWLTKDD